MLLNNIEHTVLLSHTVSISFKSKLKYGASLTEVYE